MRSSRKGSENRTNRREAEGHPAFQPDADAKRSGTSNFPRADTAVVTMQLSDDRQSRDEGLHGRTQLWASATRQLMSQEDAYVNKRHRKSRHDYELDSNAK